MKVLVKSIHTREISWMNEEDRKKQHPQFIEYFSIAQDFYQEYLKFGGKWSMETAAYLLAHQDPTDSKWRADNDIFRLGNYRKIHELIYQAHMSGEIILQPQIGRNGKTELVTENIKFIEFMIKHNKNINLPHELLKFYDTHPAILNPQKDEENSENLHKIGKKIKDGLKRGNETAAKNKKDRAQEKWAPFLKLATEKAKAHQNKYSANAIANLICKEHKGIKAGTLAKRIREDANILELLKY